MSRAEGSPTVYANRGQSIPKSILADRSHHLISGIDNSSLRVTFAKTLPQKQLAGSLANFHNSGFPDSVKPGTSPGTTADELNRKLLFHPQDEDINDRKRANSAAQLTEEVSSGAERVRKAYQLSKFKKSGVSLLYPDKKNHVKSMKGSLSGVIGLAKKESDESIGKKSKASVQSSSKSRPKKLSRKATSKSIGSTTSRKIKSGKKLKKRKKSKINELDKELEKELTKPAHLNEEYVAELSKITQILKAVTAFDESTATKNGTVVTGTGSSSGSNNATTFYSYSGGSDTDTGRSVTSSTTKAHPRRPLSGDELKQLLSSITRVVSLHQIPIDNVSGSKPNGLLARPGTSTNSAPPTTLKDTETEKAKAPVSDPLGTSSVVSTSTTKSGKKKKGKKKFKRSKPKYPTEIVDANTEPPAAKQKGKTATSTVNIKSKSKPDLVKKTKSKSKTITQSTKPHNVERGSSNESLEKDPVKHAAFLRKYFEESIRLANKNSSEDLLTGTVEAAAKTNTPTVPAPTAVTTPTPAIVAEEKPKKIVKRKKSVSKKDG